MALTEPYDSVAFEFASKRYSKAYWYLWADKVALLGWRPFLVTLSTAQQTLPFLWH